MNKEITIDKSIFKNGLCDAMAKVLHHMTSLPIGVIRCFTEPNDYDEYDDKPYTDIHAVIIIDKFSNTYLDVDGIHVGIDKMESHDFIIDSIVSVELIEISEDELDYIFTTEGIYEEHIELAEKYIYLDEKLLSIIESINEKNIQNKKI